MPLTDQALSTVYALLDQLDSAADQLARGESVAVKAKLHDVRAAFEREAHAAALKSTISPPTPIPVTVVGGLTRQGY